MQVTLSGTNSITLDLEVSQVTWRSPATQQFGAAELRIPRSSPAFSSQYISETSRFGVQISHPRLGIWDGIAKEMRIDSDGAHISAMALEWLVSTRYVAPARTFREMTAGLIARQGLLDAFGGLSQTPILIGTFTECAPLVSHYEFTGQSYVHVLADLQVSTGQEWSIRNGALCWHPRFGTFHEGRLIGGSDVVGESVRVAIDDVVTSVTATDARGASYTAYANEYNAGGIWSQEKRISVSTTTDTDLVTAAQNALAVSRMPTRIYTCELRDVGSHWNTLREGDFVTFILPHAGLQTANPSCRILSRSYGDRKSTVTLELQFLPVITTDTVSIAKDAVTAENPVSESVDVFRRVFEFFNPHQH